MSRRHKGESEMFFKKRSKLSEVQLIHSLVCNTRASYCLHRSALERRDLVLFRKHFKVLTESNCFASS